MKEEETAKLRIAIEGMHCANCSANIEKQFNKLPGVVSCSVNLANNTGIIEFYPHAIGVDELLHVFDGLAFSADVIAADAPLIDETRRAREKAIQKHDMNVFVLALVLTFIVVVLSMVPGVHGQVSSALGSLAYGPHAMSEQSHMLANIVLLVLTIPVQFGCGARFYKGAYASLKSGSSNMDVLVTLGTSIAFIYSVVITFTGMSINEGMPFFETSAVLITFVLLGKILETRAKGATNQAIESLLNLTPITARVVRGGKEEEVPLAQVVVGDTFLVFPGQSIPVDGVVVEGASEVDESMLTGEALPVLKQVDAVITGGTLNTTGSLTARALRVGSDSTLARIVRAVGDAQGSKAPVQRIADRIAGIFVPIVIVLGVVTFFGWMIVGYVTGSSNFQVALLSAVAVVVVACPCALGLATPTALMVGMGKGAQLGILIKDGEVLEMLCRLKVAVFDKTGTLTRGTPEVILSELDLHDLRLAAALESKSEHPLGRAIVAYAQTQNISALPTVSEFEALVGLGVRGIVEGREVFVGSRVEIDGFDRGGFTFADELREDTQKTLAALRDTFGIESYMVTGDSEQIAQNVARQAGIISTNVFAQVQPLDKATRISEIKKELHKDEPLAFVGDGINDAAALATADIGIAMASGTDIALDAGSVVLMHNNLRDILVSIRLSLATMRKVKQNLFWALVYNCIMIPLAAFGLLAPEFAGAAMALSSVSVVLNSLFLKRFSS